MYGSYDIKPYPNRSHQPATSIYLMSDDANAELEALHCLYCKRIIADAKGHIDKIISTPMPIADFDIAVNIRCKLCKQDYRLLVNVK